MEVLDRFSGSGNPESWLFWAERYFTYLGFAEKDWLPLPSFYLDGEALNWFNWLFRNKQFFDWTHFKAKFAQHFRHQTAIYSVRRFVGSSHVSFDSINTVPIVSQSAMVSSFPVSSLSPKTSSFEAAYETENSKADHMFDKLPVKYENVDSLTLITRSNTEIINLEDIEAPQIWNANSVEVVDLVQEPSVITEDHVLDEISLVVVSSDVHDLNDLVHNEDNYVSTVTAVCNDSCNANASIRTKVHTEVLDDTTGCDDGEEENSRDSTIAGLFDKFPQWDTLDFLIFTSQGIVVSNASVKFDVIEFPFDGTLRFSTIPWLSSYLEEISGANQTQMSLFGLHKCNWVDTGQERNFPGFLLSKSRECAREQKIQQGLQVLVESHSKKSPHIRVVKVVGHLFSQFGLVHKASYVDKWFNTGQVLKVALGRVDMSVVHNGNSIQSCAMYKLLGESIANSFMCSVDDATTQIEEQYIIDQLRSFSSGRTLALSVLHHALTFIMVVWITQTFTIRDNPLEFVVAITKKPSSGINSTLSFLCALVMFDILEVLDGCCYQLLAGQSKLLFPQLGLGLAQCLGVMPCFLSAYNHDQLPHIAYNHEQLLHIGKFDLIYVLGRAEFLLALLHFSPDESGLDFPFDPGSSFLFTIFYGATRNCAFWTASGTSPTKFMPSDVWNLLEIPICDNTIWTIVIFGSILDGDFSSTTEFLADLRQKGRCILISLDLNSPFGVLTVVLQLASRQLFDTENAHKDALLKIVGALAETSVHYTALVHVVFASPLALTCGERATSFLELKNSIANNLGQVPRTRIVEFREVLAGADAEQCVLESHAGGSFMITRDGFSDDLGRGTKITVIKSTVEHHKGVAKFVDIFANYEAFMVAQLHMQEGTDCIFSQTYRRVLDWDAAMVKLTFSIREVYFTIHFTREYFTPLLETNCHIFYNDKASVKTNWLKKFHRKHAPVLDTYTLVWCELGKNSFDLGNSIDEQNLFDGIYIHDLNLEDKVLFEGRSIVMNQAHSIRAYGLEVVNGPESVGIVGLSKILESFIWDPGPFSNWLEKELSVRKKGLCRLLKKKMFVPLISLL